MDERTRPVSPRAVAAGGGRELAAGDRIGAWTVIRTLAHGGFGTVYEVRSARGDIAALKLLHAHLVSSPEMLARFEREISVIGRLRHPNIVQLIDAGFSGDDHPYLCMELLDGEELSQMIERRGPLSALLALEVFEPLCDALATAHELGIVHRDVKASNVLVCRPEPGAELGRVVLLDFGIAKLSDALLPELTATNQSLGTPACMAPEQIQGMRVDARSDVYALGGLLFHIVTGRLPFFDPSPTMTQYLHLHARRPRASALADVPARLDDVIVQAMAIDPAERFPDAITLLAAARAALRDATVVTAVSVGEASAILVSIVDRSGGATLDASLLDDLERVVPLLERFLAERGFTLALDLGSTAILVARTGPESALAAALAAWEHLEQRPGRDPRVQIGLAVHRDEATIIGDHVESPSLLRPASWRVPESLEGVWVTPAIDPSAPQGRRVR